MHDAKKPELSLIPVSLMNDLDALVAFFTKVTGKTPTQDEIDELRAEMRENGDGPPFRERP